VVAPFAFGGDRSRPFVRPGRNRRARGRRSPMAFDVAQPERGGGEMPSRFCETLQAHENPRDPPLHGCPPPARRLAVRTFTIKIREMMTSPRFKRILLKLSGEVLMGEGGLSISPRSPRAGAGDRRCPRTGL
jgi:hypothetical protein